MCLENKDLSNKEADCCRKEVSLSLTKVTELLNEIIHAAASSVHQLKERRAHKR